MATYTAEQLKTLTSVGTVAQMVDEKIILFQSTAESILNSLDMDASMTGYQDAYKTMVVSVFDWLADNPTALRSSGKGKQSKTFSEMLPPSVMVIAKKFIEGAGGMLVGAPLHRSDIGLR